MMDVLSELDPASLEIFHQTGRDDRARVEAAYAEAGFRAEVVDFTDALPDRYRWADLAVCRAGALTVAELALAGLPALLVPYPYAADDHQAANARALADVGGAWVLGSRPLQTTAVVDALEALAADPHRLEAMGRALAKRARPDAARVIVRLCTRWVRKEGDGSPAGSRGRSERDGEPAAGGMRSDPVDGFQKVRSEE
jgi:UDP-N-acetylglucosamine--N-acetylmuramyl-(pentapeptide) pyrophosphoryl-undecaprenol N-acetylglucosamine transferase